MRRSPKSRPAELPCPVPSGVLHEGEWSHVCECLSLPPEKAIRLRPPAAFGRGVACQLPFQSDPVPWFSETDSGSGCFVRDEFQPGRFLHHAAGMYFVQDAGSMLALRLLDVKPSETVADLCAAPGAKASAILEIIGPGSGWLLANEPIRGRVAALEYSLARTGYARYVVTAQDPAELELRLPRSFDAVLVDAPCTGQTLLSRGRQNVAAFSSSQVEHSAARQRRILKHAASLVRPGGRLVYSTCTFAHEENEGVITAFLQDHPSWCVEDCPGLESWKSPLEPGGYRLWPHRDRCAGGYAIRLRYAEHPSGESGALTDREMARNLRAAKNVAAHNEITAPNLLRSLPWDHENVGALTKTAVETRGKQRFGWLTGMPQPFVDIAASGPEIAFQPASFWLPSHSLALRRDAAWAPSQTVELSDTDATRYMQGNALSSLGQGWFVAAWNGNPLGWLHSNAQRANNSLPAAARQR